MAIGDVLTMSLSLLCIYNRNEVCCVKTIGTWGPGALQTRVAVMTHFGSLQLLQHMTWSDLGLAPRQQGLGITET